MKPYFFLIVSLAANVALGIAYINRDANTQVVVTPPTIPSSSDAPAAGLTTEQGRKLEQTWTGLQAGDLHTLADRAKKAGLPPAIAHALIVSEINESFSRRRKELLSKQADIPYWKDSPFLDPKTMVAWHKLTVEQNDLYKELLGPNAIDQDPGQMLRDRQYKGLPEHAINAIDHITSDYSDLRSQVLAESNGLLLPEDTEKLAYLQKEERADLERTLSPEELAAYDLRTSNTAAQLRSLLSGFNPSESEFTAIFELQKKYNEQFGGLNGPSTPQQAAAAAQHQAELTEQIKATLGPDRFAEYQKATDPVARTTGQFAARFNLDPAVATDLVSLQQDISARAAALLNPATPNTNRNAQLAALADEANQRLNTALADAHQRESYKQSVGQWMQMLQPSPVPR